MADNDQENDEYKFTEFDSLENESMEQTDADKQTAASESPQYNDGKNIKRNALIAIGVIILAMVMYKLIGMIFSTKTTVSTQSSVAPIAAFNPPSTQPISPPQPEVTTPAPAPVVQQPVTNSNDSELTQKVNAIEQSQQTVRAEVNSVGEQVGTVNNNINNLNAQIANLNAVIGNLSTQVAKQSEEINLLMQRAKPKKIVVRPQIRMQRLVYYIQAVIPGRAWLIGSNGSTLTVREGTKIAGYGTVRLIDSLQGRIVTSSGQIIRFSQEDS